jgi:hypothetical protein
MATTPEDCKKWRQDKMLDPQWKKAEYDRVKAYKEANRDKIKEYNRKYYITKKLKEGIQQSRCGQLVHKGSFAKYAKETEEEYLLSVLEGMNVKLDECLDELDW